MDMYVCCRIYSQMLNYTSLDLPSKFPKYKYILIVDYDVPRCSNSTFFRCHFYMDSLVLLGELIVNL